MSLIITKMVLPVIPFTFRMIVKHYLSSIVWTNTQRWQFGVARFRSRHLRCINPYWPLPVTSLVQRRTSRLSSARTNPSLRQTSWWSSICWGGVVSNFSCWKTDKSLPFSRSQLLQGLQLQRQKMEKRDWDS